MAFGFKIYLKNVKSSCDLGIIKEKTISWK